VSRVALRERGRAERLVASPDQDGWPGAGERRAGSPGGHLGPDLGQELRGAIRLVQAVGECRRKPFGAACCETCADDTRDSANIGAIALRTKAWPMMGLVMHRLRLKWTRTESYIALVVEELELCDQGHPADTETARRTRAIPFVHSKCPQHMPAFNLGE